MRLWHYKLIPYLPNKMLVSEWRELIAIKRQWEKGTLNHRLVDYVLNYDKKYFIQYVTDVCDEMKSRGINYKEELFNELFNFCCNEQQLLYEHYAEHNDRYLLQCYFNLQEKYDRGIITVAEWNKIYNFVREEI